jgi:hypothetical protein
MRRSNTIREILNQLVSTFKQTKRIEMHHDTTQATEETSQFEKTYFSFPEFIEPTPIYHQNNTICQN